VCRIHARLGVSLIGGCRGIRQWQDGGMSEPLSAEKISRELAILSGWSGDTGGISRTVELPTFPAAIAVVDEVALVAEELDHHPDIDVRWRTLTFRCVTHSAGGVTDLDLRLAGRINAIVESS
jgi:4a-hydroxytetrahydrobiopterin dehydratase